MPLGGEVPVAVAQDLEVEPGDDVERAEGRAEVTAADALDHVEDVQPAGVGKGGGPLLPVAVERPDPVELCLGDVPKRHALNLAKSEQLLDAGVTVRQRRRPSAARGAPKAGGC